VESRVNFALVGLFVLVLGATGIGGILWLSGVKGFQAEYETYYAYMTESVSGLNRDAPVKYHGVDVGQVRQIALVVGDPDRVRLVLDIEAGTPIRQDTVAVLRTQGLTGIAYVELSSSGEDPAPLRPKPGERFPVIQTGPSLMVRLDNAVTTLLTQLTNVSENLNALLAPGNRAALGDVMKDLRTVSSTLAERAPALDASLASAARAMENTAALTAKLAGITTRVERSLDRFDHMTAAVSRAGENANGTIDLAHKELQRFGGETVPELQSLVRELRELTASLKRMSTQIERNPRSLLFGPRRKPGPGEE